MWSEIWDVVGPLMHSVLSGGPALWREHQLLFINSRGFAQETFHTFSQSPVPGDDGKVGGVLLTVQETTEQVQGERQLETLRALAERTSDRARPRRRPASAAASVLAGADADVPFSLVYLPGRRRHAGDARRVEPGVPRRARSSLRARRAEQRLAVPRGAALRSSPSASTTSSRRFGVPARRPLRRHAASGPSSSRCSATRRDRYGFVVFGLSPWRAPSESTSASSALVATQLVSAIARARASEEERRRAEAMAELDRAKTLFFSNISHELRTPLTLMLGPTTDALSLARRTLEGQDLEIVHRNALRLQKLVGQPARLRAHRGRARPRVARARPARRPHQGAGARFRVGDARRRPRVRGPAATPLPHPS